MSVEDRREENERERDARVHHAALSRQGSTGAPETLKYVSDPEDLDSPAEALEWINSKSASTTNLDHDDVRSKEWVVEYFQLLARMDKPPHYGVHGWRRAWARGDIDGREEPLEPGDALTFEGFGELGKLTTKKSEDGWGVETSTRDTKESIMRKDEQESSGGIIDRFRS
jgi:hypothetical protein